MTPELWFAYRTSLPIWHFENDTPFKNKTWMMLLEKWSEVVSDEEILSCERHGDRYWFSKDYIAFMCENERSAEIRRRASCYHVFTKSGAFHSVINAIDDNEAKLRLKQTYRDPDIFKLCCCVDHTGMKFREVL
jgi:hypothetical protein